jgi:hypothetical protein
MKKKLKYICPECKAMYEGPQGATPFIVSWNDGHFCTPRLVGEEEVKKLSDKTESLRYDELWTTYYN